MVHATAPPPLLLGRFLASLHIFAFGMLFKLLTVFFIVPDSKRLRGSIAAILGVSIRYRRMGLPMD